MNIDKAAELFKFDLMRIESLDPRFTYKSSGVYESGNIYYEGKFWAKIFIVAEDGCQIGRITLQFEHDERKVLTVKSYKKWNYPYSENDNIFFMLEHYFETGKFICDFDDIVEKAKINVEEKYQKKVQWRLDHPKPTVWYIGEDGKRRKRKGRKGLQRTNLRNEISNVIREIFINVQSTNQ